MLLLWVKIYGRMREVGLLKIIDGEDVPASDYIKVKIKLFWVYSKLVKNVLLLFTNVNNRYR